MGSNRRDTGERTEAVSYGQEIFTECQLCARHTTSNAWNPSSTRHDSWPCVASSPVRETEEISKPITKVYLQIAVGAVQE